MIELMCRNRPDGAEDHPTGIRHLSSSSELILPGRFELELFRSILAISWRLQLDLLLRDPCAPPHAIPVLAVVASLHEGRPHGLHGRAHLYKGVQSLLLGLLTAEKHR